MTLTHDQLEGHIGQWFLDVMRCYPTLTEQVVGIVPGVPEGEGHEQNRSWIADVAGMVRPTRSRLKLMNLPWNATKRYHLTWLCEVKVTRADFLSDDKFTKASPVHLRFLATPKGMLTHDEVPDGWGLLESTGTKVHRWMKRLKVCQVSEVVENYFLMTLVNALWWRHENESRLTMQRKVTSDQAIARDAYKVSGIIQAVLDYVTGKETLEQYLKYQGIRRAPAWRAEKQAEKVRDAYQSHDGCRERLRNET